MYGTLRCWESWGCTSHGSERALFGGMPSYRVISYGELLIFYVLKVLVPTAQVGNVRSADGRWKTMWHAAHTSRTTRKVNQTNHRVREVHNYPHHHSCCSRCTSTQVGFIQ